MWQQRLQASIVSLQFASFSHASTSVLSFSLFAAASLDTMDTASGLATRRPPGLRTPLLSHGFSLCSDAQAERGRIETQNEGGLRATADLRQRISNSVCVCVHARHLLSLRGSERRRVKGQILVARLALQSLLNNFCLLICSPTVHSDAGHTHTHTRRHT